MQNSKSDMFPGLNGKAVIFFYKSLVLGVFIRLLQGVVVEYILVDQTQLGKGPVQDRTCNLSICGQT